MGSESRPDSEERTRLDVERVYQNDQISVLWEPKLCIHVGNCYRGAPEVFQPNRRPWVKLDGASPHQIAEVVRSCPTGALHFVRHDGDKSPVDQPAIELQDAVAQEAQAQALETDEMIINVRPNGPLYVRGRVRVEGIGGFVMRKDIRLALCRCGASANKPFCDGSHRQIGFRAMEKPPKPDE